MRCPIETPESAELLLAYCSRKLDAASTPILEEHLEVCPACRSFVESQRTVWQALDTWEAAPVSPDFDRWLYQRIENEVSWWDMMWRPLRPLLWQKSVPIMAAAALLIVAAVLLERPARVPSGASRDSQLEEVAPEQAEHTLEEMEAIREFSGLVRPEPPPGPRM